MLSEQQCHRLAKHYLGFDTVDLKLESWRMLEPEDTATDGDTEEGGKGDGSRTATAGAAARKPSSAGKHLS